MPQLGLGNSLITPGTAAMGVTVPADKVYYEFCHNFSLDYDGWNYDIIIPWLTENELKWQSGSTVLDGDNIIRCELLLPFDSQLKKINLRTEDVNLTTADSQPATLDWKIYETSDGQDNMLEYAPEPYLDNISIRQTGTMYTGYSEPLHAATDQNVYKEIGETDFTPSLYTYDAKSLITITMRQVSPDAEGNFGTTAKDWFITSLWEKI